MDNPLSAPYTSYPYPPFWPQPYQIPMQIPTSYDQQMFQIRQFHLNEAQMAGMEQ